MSNSAVVSGISAILGAASDKGVDVVRVDDLADDSGMAVVFAASDIYADIEYLDTGEINAGTRDIWGMPRVWSVAPDAIGDAVDKIAEFLRTAARAG